MKNQLGVVGGGGGYGWRHPEHPVDELGRDERPGVDDPNKIFVRRSGDRIRFLGYP